MLRRRAERELRGLGDARLGEWRTFEGSAYHIRRRLTPAEAAQGGVEQVRDIRHSDEAIERAAALGPLLALLPDALLAEEAGPPLLVRFRAAQR